MKSIQLMIVFLSLVTITSYYSLYNTNDREELNSVFDCLYAHIRSSDVLGDGSHKFYYNLIPYCQRLDKNEEHEKLPIISYENVQSEIKFSELYKQGVTSLDLLDWFAPIDVAERYEINGQNSDEIFYNCSCPWFGSTCQYKLLTNNISSSFGEVVKSIFDQRGRASLNATFIIGTCYKFLNNCNRGSKPPACLDWREICDGNFDCINGDDEELCSIMEINECSNDEFRCHYSAECIPWSFVRDGNHSIDCLDTTDEKTGLMRMSFDRSHCYKLPTFECEESANPGSPYFSCGDGQFVLYFPPHFDLLNICFNRRNTQMARAIHTSLDYISEKKCQQAFLCLLDIDEMGDSDKGIVKDRCESLSDHCMSKQWLIFPTYPFIYRLFQFIYFTNRSIGEFKINILPDLVCFNQSVCPYLLYCSIDIQIYNGLKCCQIHDLDRIPSKIKRWYSLHEEFGYLVDRCTLIGKDDNCFGSSLFHCRNSSKCISKRQLADGRKDCYFDEDEDVSGCELNDTKRFTCKTIPDKCYSIVAIDFENQKCAYPGYENPIYKSSVWTKPLPFGKICDGIRDRNKQNIWNDTDDTDETNCTWWPCNNPYVRCDSAWHCLNGLDELNCSYTSCSANEHGCVTGWDTLIRNCFPITHLMEDYTKFNIESSFREIYLTNKTIENITNYLFYSPTKCMTLEYLSQGRPVPSFTDEDVCLMPDFKIYDVDKLVRIKTGIEYCDFNFVFDRFPMIAKRSSFRTSRLGYFPSELFTEVSLRRTSSLDQSKNFDLQIDKKEYWYCNRGILILFKTKNSYKCLCPPSYFGNQCQWQNQRISLTIQLIYRNFTFIKPMPVFQLIIILIDDRGQIGPYHEQLTYAPERDCGFKFNIYLLYPDKPKNSSANYSIRIDLFDKMTLTYWGSWHLSIPFQFLPVNRISTQLFITNIKESELSCGNHGKYFQYINKNLSYFCKCDEGYSGLKCDIKENCSCSSDSYCLTSSICICPINKFGRKCYLNNSICELKNNPCQNNGQCIPIDDRIGMKKFTCFCTENFNGIECGNKINKTIDIEFDENIIKSGSVVFIHWLTSLSEMINPHHTRLLKKIKYGQNRIKINAEGSFHFVFIQSINGSYNESINEKKYYLIVKREQFIEVAHIQTKLLSNQQCVFMNELLNKTLQSDIYLRRVKYYPLLCRQKKELMCFYDEHYMCLCDLDRFSNCFVFDHNITYNCQGQNDCKHDGICLQENTTACAIKSLCICPDCFYGAKCQFSTKGFILSLDYILGYHIKPNVTFSEQPIIIKTSTAIVTIMFVFGLISGILSIVTFRRKKIRDIGVGFYLFVSSWISILIIIVLLIKFCQLILFQMETVTNSRLFTINCILLDMIIKVLIASNDWLDGCVSIERIVTVIKGVHFDKGKSKKMAKWISLTVIIVVILTHLHDPLNRLVIDDIDVDEKRTWCIVQYSPSINIFNSFITLFHFLIPFTLNSCSIMIIVIIMARSRANLVTRLTYMEHFKLQFKERKHHFIASCALVLLSLPRLIISFISGCMKSPNNSWLFLFGYLISFFPSMMIFFVYVLPSKAYKEEFNTVRQKVIRRFRSRT